jgi:hypothetical protein
MADVATVNELQDFVFEDEAGLDPSRDEFQGFEGLEGVAVRDKHARIAVVRTSDRSNFRRCRRRWGWQSHLRGNLTPKEHASPLWLGSGFHFALEDYHGHHRYPKPRDAFVAYVKATKAQAQAQQKQLPGSWMEDTKLGVEMLDYYSDLWMIGRDPLETFIFNDTPQVEVHALVPVPFSTPHYDQVLYACTLDRVIIDELGRLWIVEYKTAKTIFTLHYQTDPQIGAYQWIAPVIYGKPIEGVIYQQHRKAPPGEPNILTSGEVSTAKHQRTTHRYYRQALVKLYGKEVIKWPHAQLDYLNQLAKQESIDYDAFVRRDRIRRNEHQRAAEGTKLLLELEDMLNPNLPLYPSPTRDCANLCSFHNACVSMDDGSDWEYDLEVTMQQKEATFDSWRAFLPVESALQS